ncbi:hypothetical protein [Microbacterium sp. NPDC058389]|uniref:hypothetical protein n=1 Tax=Microbacterium sp. NPDC058389 TaxID=3346475 RepID=UPI003657CAF9
MAGRDPMTDVDDGRGREIALRIGEAVRNARRVLDALDDTPSNQFDYAHYWHGYNNLDSVLRELLEACEAVNWERTAEHFARHHREGLDGHR